MDKNINQRCFHCGADEMLHQADTDRCPANGQESGNVGATGWRDTIFTLPPERPAEAPASSSGHTENLYSGLIERLGVLAFDVEDFSTVKQFKETASKLIQQYLIARAPMMEKELQEAKAEIEALRRDDSLPMRTVIHERNQLSKELQEAKRQYEKLHHVFVNTEVERKLFGEDKIKAEKELQEARAALAESLEHFDALLTTGDVNIGFADFMIKLRAALSTNTKD